MKMTAMMFVGGATLLALAAPTIAAAQDGYAYRAAPDRYYDGRDDYRAGPQDRIGYVDVRDDYRRGPRYRGGYPGTYGAGARYWRDGFGRLCHRRQDGVRRCEAQPMRRR